MNLSETAKRIAAKLPLDVLEHPMPFPSRLDYAEKIIREEMNEDLRVLKDQWEKRISNLENRLTRTTCDEDRAIGIQECVDDLDEALHS